MLKVLPRDFCNLFSILFCNAVPGVGGTLRGVLIDNVSIYSPNVDNPNFFRTIENLILLSDAEYNLLCGDFNLVLDPSKDAFNYHKINNPNSRHSVLEIMNANNLIDIFRLCHPNDKRYTWRRKNPIKQGRLDYFLISNSMFDLGATVAEW